jgi:hypothetical protein
MPTSLALDPRHVLWSAPETQRAGRPLIVLMHGWSYDERHLFAFAHLFPAQMVVASVRAPYAEALPGVSSTACSSRGSSSMTISPAMRSWPGSGRRFSGDEANVTRSSRSRRSPARNPGWRRTHPRKASDTAGWGTTLPVSR